MPENFVTSDGLKIWTISTGAGRPAVMLCSGGPGCCDYLAPLAAMLDDAHRVVRFEQRGCGRSQHTISYDIEDCLTDLENVRSYYGIDRWVIGGHSWGADLALAYALEHPERTAGLICLSGGRVHDDRGWHEEYRRRKAAEGEREPAFDYPHNMDVNRQLNRRWRQYIQHPTLLKRISELAVPALFVYGGEGIRQRWPTEQVANLMPGARFELIEGARHAVWLTHGDELRVLLRDFVGRVGQWSPAALL